MLQVWAIMRQKCWLFFPLHSFSVFGGNPFPLRSPLQKVFIQWNGFSISEVRTKKFVAMTNLKCQQRQPQPSVIVWEQLELMLLVLPWGELWPELSHSLHLGVAIKREHRLTVSWANCEALLLGGWHFLVAKSLFIGRCHLSALQSTHIFNGDY